MQKLVAVENITNEANEKSKIYASSLEKLKTNVASIMKKLDQPEPEFDTLDKQKFEIAQKLWHSEK